MRNKSLIILLLILFFAFFLRLPLVLKDQFPFVFDMGRDMLWTRDIVVLHKPYLIGPWGSLQGVFFGPAWYWLLSIPFLISGGDPRGSVFLVMLFNLATIFLAYLFGKRVKNESLGIFFALLTASSSIMISLSTYAFHANLLPFTTLVFVWSLFEVLRRKEKFLSLASLVASLNFHFEPATAIFTTLTLFIFLAWQRKIFKKVKIILISVFSFFLPFVPQIIFELRHQFLQTKALMAYFQGKNKSLGGELPLKLRIGDRLIKFLELFSSGVNLIVEASPKWLVILFLLMIVLVLGFVLKKGSKKEKDFIKVNLLVILIPFISYIFLFPPELKSWYLYGLAIPFILLVGLAIAFLWQRSFLSFLFLLIFLILINPNLHSRIHDFFKSRLNSQGPEILAIQKRVIDWIYQDATDQPFSVFVYTPPIYDYHYQYLFWWYGKKKYTYWPEEYSYLPGKIDYVPYKEKYLAIQHALQAPQQTDLFYLIIEPDEIEQRTKGWQANFSKSELLEKKVFETGLIVEKRKKNEI